LYVIYSKLKDITEKEFEGIVNATNFIGGCSWIHPKKISVKK